MELQDWWGLNGIPFIIALVEVIKRTFRLNKRYIPILSVILGVGFNVALAPSMQTDLLPAILVGIMAGLAACGMYSGIKASWGK